MEKAIEDIILEVFKKRGEDDEGRVLEWSDLVREYEDALIRIHKIVNPKYYKGIC